MNATIKNTTGDYKFIEWSELIEFLNSCKDKNIPQQLLISIHTAQTFWQYSLDSDIKSMLQVVHVLKDINYKVDRIWDNYLDALPGD
jgi:hypothetical protein